MNQHRLTGWWLHGILMITAILVLIPFLWMVSISLSDYGAVFQRFLLIFPTSVSLEGYRQVLENSPFMRWFFNSVFVAGCLTIGQLTLGVLAAYAFARYRFKGSEPLFFFVLCTMMIPPQAILFPLFMVINAFDWVNTYQGVIVPHLASGYAIFVLRQFFLQIPKELDEAARIDGCHGFQILYHVYLRSAVPAIISVGLIQLVRNWNDYYWTLVVLRDSQKMTLPVGIVAFRDETLVQWVPTMAAATLSVLPVLVIYVLGQRYFVQSHVHSGIK
ncbi:carbohydrate ABC transporter permease [Anoxynatronum sibiricum]|uniref:Carbohydrate ABC transporter permease n=1 Tax=Anoxynatronum sibiricum TaxID=210623 RepID=A0ABU9VWK1_9CLOT